MRSTGLALFIITGAVMLSAARRQRFTAVAVERLAIGSHCSNCAATHELEFFSSKPQDYFTGWWSSTMPILAF